MENKELLEKAKQANSPEELLTLAKENGYPLDEDGAKAYFEKIHKLGELPDDELDNVAGGGCYTKDGKRRLIVTTGNSCEEFKCKHCGKIYRVARTCLNNSEHECSARGNQLIPCRCSNCFYCSYEGLKWLCNNEERRKK